jgi:ABC-type antimicrobial peptide transport system permease subunit
VLLGLPLALASGGLLGRIVYQGPVNDAATLSGVPLIVGLVGLVACWLPARRALRLDPAAALYLE